MATALSQFNPGDIITAQSLKDRLDVMEKYINGNIVSSDFSTDPWVKTEHIVKPEFYGAPSSRFIGVSSDVYHRHVRNNIQEFDLFTEEMGVAWHPVPSLSASFYCDQAAVIEVYASFWVYETGGSVTIKIGDENTRAARLKLFLDGVSDNSTLRSVAAGSTSSDAEYFHRRYHHIAWRSPSALAKGPHSVSIRIQPDQLADIASRSYAKVYVGTRGLNITLRYL